MAIKTFRCKDTRRLFDRTPVRRFRAIEKVARRKLVQLHARPRLISCAFRPAIGWKR
jgi:proteic killer suppression protein